MALTKIVASRSGHRTTLIPFSGIVDDGSTLSLDFTTGVLDPRLTFQRLGNATFINSSGLVEFAGQNVLVQTANMTLWTGPTNIDTTAWGSKDDPFGGTTAVRLTPTGTVTAAAHNLQSAPVSSSTLGNGLRTVYSVYAKAATSRYRILGMVTDANNAQGSFVLSGAGEGTATAHLGTNVTVSMTPVGNGWYRCVMTWPSTAPAASASCWCAVLQNNTTTPSGQAFTAQSDDVTGGHGIFVYGAQWEQGSTPHPFIPTTGTAKSDVPRFDYDPTSIGTPRGLLIEGSANNLAYYSESFNPANWTTTGLSGGVVTSTSQTNPAGISSAIRLVEDTANTAHATYQTIGGLTVGNTYTFSVYVRGDGTRTLAGIRITLGGAATDYSVIFDLADGTTGTVYTAGSPGTVTLRAVQHTGGWWRLSVTINAPSANTLLYIYNATTKNASGGLQAFLGTGNGIYVWGAQVETGSGASSYIPTGASQGSRAADFCYMSGISSWFNAPTGTIISKVTYSSLTGSNGGIELSVGTGSSSTNRIAIRRDYVDYYSGGGAAQAEMYPTVTSGAVQIGTAYAANDFAMCSNGGTMRTDSSGAVPIGLDTLKLYSDAGSSSGLFLNGWMRSFKYFPTRLPNAQLQSLTT